jgi:hypothetical protein
MLHIDGKKAERKVRDASRIIGDVTAVDVERNVP